MNILGTIYLMDESSIGIIKNELAKNPPPSMGGKIICIDLDETDDEIEMMFPDHCSKATLLLPPPAVIYKEIDGDQEGFIEEYDDYLDHENSVQDVLASMLQFLHIGGNILLKSPSPLEDGATWLNTFMIFMYTRFGISIGTQNTPFSYDNNYDGVIATFLYQKEMINVFDYCNAYPDMINPDITVMNKVYYELSHFTGPYETPDNLYRKIKNNIIETGVPILKPGVIFME